jgi:hypothetical protein
MEDILLHQAVAVGIVERKGCRPWRIRTTGSRQGPTSIILCDFVRSECNISPLSTMTIRQVIMNGHSRSDSCIQSTGTRTLDPSQIATLPVRPGPIVGHWDRARPMLPRLVIRSAARRCGPLDPEANPLDPNGKARLDAAVFLRYGGRLGVRSLQLAG